MGFALRSFLLPQGIPGVTAGKRPPTVSPAFFPAAETTGRSSGPRFLGFDPCGSPLTSERVFSTPAAGCFPGLCPSWVTSASALARISPSLLSRAYPSERRASRRATPQSFDQRSLHFIPRSCEHEAGRSHPLRVPAPAKSLPFRCAPVRAMCSPCTASHVTAD
jgi:hypothetical protein